MEPSEIAVGTRVRCPRTGTAGTVLHIETVRGETFAELDSTSLLYRVDQLIPASGAEKRAETRTEDARTIAAREREYAASSDYQDALKNLDQSCEGGG